MTVVWALTWLGQSAALAALTAAFVRLPACRASAAARHAVWTVAFFLGAGLLAWPLMPAAAAPALQSAVGNTAHAPAAASLPIILLPEPVITVSVWVGLAWAAGAAAGLALVGFDLWRVVRLKRRTVPLTPKERGRLDAALSRRVPGGATRLAWCDEMDAPGVLGFTDPVIALPRSQVSSLSDEQFSLVVLHELAHIRRGDDWWALAERTILALAWVNPAVHWVRRELSLAREMACDEWVVRQTAAPVAYAKCLADLAGLRTQARRLRLSAGVNGRPSTLRRRIVAVLACDRRPSARVMGMLAWMGPVAVCVAAAGLLQLPPMIAVAPQAAAAPVVAARFSPPELAGRPAVPAPAASPAPGRPPSAARRPGRASQLVPSAQAPVHNGAVDGAPAEAHASPADVREQNAAAPRAPLASSPLPGAGAVGVLAAGGLTSASIQQAAPRRWWSVPVEVSEAMGGGAAAAGRATASFVGRVGSRVPQLLER